MAWKSDPKNSQQDYLERQDIGSDWARRSGRPCDTASVNGQEELARALSAGVPYVALVASDTPTLPVALA